MGFSRCFAAAALLTSWLPVQAAVADIELPVSAVTSEIESDWTSVYYGKTPLLLGNDGSAGTGGWLAWNIDSASPLSQVHAETPGRRTKAVTVIHGRDDDKKQTGLAVSIGQPDSILRAWELPDFKEVKSARTTALGDWSALCSWKSQSGADYVYLFGKKQAKVFLVRKDDDEDDYEDAEIVEVWSLIRPLDLDGWPIKLTCDRSKPSLWRSSLRAAQPHPHSARCSFRPTMTKTCMPLTLLKLLLPLLSPKLARPRMT